MISADQNLIVRFAQGNDDVVRAQRLRYRVFVEELGATASDQEHTLRQEIDKFDDYAHHLILIDPQIEKVNYMDAVVGVYRLTDDAQANRAGGFYSQDEYDIDQLLSINGKKLELGRSCLDKDYRGGAAMAMLWSALGEFVINEEIDFLFGTASFHGTQVEGKRHALSNLYHNFLSEPDLRPTVRTGSDIDMNILPADAVDRLYAMRETPSLIKAYLRLGGKIGDGAFRDDDFNTIDVFVLMQTGKMTERVKRVYRA